MDNPSEDYIMKIIFVGDSLTKGRPGLSYVEMLQQQLPQHTIINYGKNGDSVVSLYYRMKKTPLEKNIDIAFLWVGINDVLTYIAEPWSLIPKIVLNQPWARTKKEFHEYYQKILDLLHPNVHYIVTVSLLFIGEDITNKWNKQLEELSKIINTLSDPRQNIHFLDLRKNFLLQYPSASPSEYTPSSWVLLFDGFLHKTPQEIDTKSKERKLHFTIDGVHLNSAGTHYIAEVFHDTITKLIQHKTREKT